MATNTTNYHLVKPDTTDFYDISVPNSNMDIIDTQLKSAADHRTSSNNPHGVTKAQVGLGNVNNTADLDKPISTATQAALNAKAPAYTYGTTDLTAGVSTLATGTLYFVYE